MSGNRFPSWKRNAYFQLSTHNYRIWLLDGNMFPCCSRIDVADIDSDFYFVDLPCVIMSRVSVYLFVFICIPSYLVYHDQT